MTEPVRPLHLVPDVTRHGVTGYARAIAAACGAAVSAEPPAPPAGPLHLHFTERLWGATPEAAAEAVCELARRQPLSVTLHDLPQASDGELAQRRRGAAYARVVDAAAAVACNSHWEAELLGAFASPGTAPTVIPLAVWPPAEPPGAAPAPGGSGGAEPPVIGILGFVYPGKGHAEAIAAAAACAATRGHRVDVVALGAVSDGHAADVASLASQARDQGVSFTVTGYLGEAELLSRARQVAVPLAAHQHVSASASIGSWLSAGRRPLVADSAYAAEIDALRPHTIRRYAPERLSAAVGDALADPSAGWLAPGVSLAPGPGETAAAYLRWWTEAVPW
jgi:glycosyltransferase involved in cell wall biosynthesis